MKKRGLFPRPQIFTAASRQLLHARGTERRPRMNTGKRLPAFWEPRREGIFSLKTWNRRWRRSRRILRAMMKRSVFWKRYGDMWKALIPFSRKRKKAYRKGYGSGTACSCPYLISWIWTPRLWRKKRLQRKHQKNFRKKNFSKTSLHKRKVRGNRQETFCIPKIHWKQKGQQKGKILKDREMQKDRNIQENRKIRKDRKTSPLRPISVLPMMTWAQAGQSRNSVPTWKLLLLWKR